MFADVEVPSLWSKRTAVRRKNQGAESQYRKPYESAMVDVIDVVERAAADDRLDADDPSCLRERVAQALRGDLLAAGAPRQNSLRRYASECRADGTLVDPFPGELSNAEILVLLAAEWSFSPIGEGVVLATRGRPATTWVDIRSGLHATWWWAVEHNVGLGRALGAILDRGDQVLAFRPFLGLFDRLLDLHSYDAERTTLMTQRFAVLAGQALIRVEVMRAATEFLIRPALIDARAFGIAPGEESQDPTSEEAIDDQLARLLFALEAAGDASERARIRSQIERLLKRLRYFDASDEE